MTKVDVFDRFYAKECRQILFHKCRYFPKVKEIKQLRGGVACYAAQATAPMDAEIGKIDHLWMETSSFFPVDPGQDLPYSPVPDIRPAISDSSCAKVPTSEGETK